MANYLDNTIYTNHALKKIGKNLVGNYENFNFIKIKIGSGDSSLSQNRADLSASMYSLRIQEVIYNKEDGYVTIQCEIPTELADIPITEIGLFDTVLGVDHLFSYSRVEITKPSDLGYELTVVLNLGPRTIEFPGVTEFQVNEEEYVSRQYLSDFTDLIMLIDSNLERTVYKNSKKIGLNMPEVAYSRQKAIRELVRNNTYANIYSSLDSTYKGLVTDMFFIHEPKYLSYDIVNFADGNSVLESYHGLYKASRDNISFNNGPMTLCWVSKIDELNAESVLFNKKDDTALYLSVETKPVEVTWGVYLEDGDITPRVSKLNAITISVYGQNNEYNMTYFFNMKKQGEYVGSHLPYILTFNGNLNEPQFNLYVDGVKVETYTEAEMTQEFVEKDANGEVNETDAYGKILISKGDISDMPDYTERLPLKNYEQDYDSVEKYNYQNALGVSFIMSMKKEATPYDVAFLNSILRNLGESED